MVVANPEPCKDFYANKRMAKARMLLTHMFEIREVNDDDHDRLARFESRYFYKECFSTAHGANLVNTCGVCDMTLIALWKYEIVGLIQCMSPKYTGFLKLANNATIIMNFCIQKYFRSFGLGHSMLQNMLQRLENPNVYIAINKKEPLNDATRLFKFYVHHGFEIKSYETNKYIVLQHQRIISMTPQHLEAQTMLI